MAILNPVNVGTTPDDGTGDVLRSAFIKINGNEANLNADVTSRQISPTNRVVVNTAADFPTPVADVITLADNTEYWIGSSNVDVGNDRFVMGTNTVIAGAAAGTAMISSTTTGVLFTSTDFDQNTWRDISVDADTATIFDATDTVQGVSIHALINVRILRAASLGNATNLLAINWSNSGMFDSDQGILLGGLINVISLRQVLLQSTSATFKSVDLGAVTSPTIELQDLVCVGPSGAIGISGLASNGNVLAGSIASVLSCEFLGGLTPLENITKDDTQWSFRDNLGISDTIKAALVHYSGNATATIINTIDVYEKVNAVWTEQLAKHFVTDATGKITYKGERPLTIYIDAVVDVLSSASNNIVQMALFKNGLEEHSGIEALSSTTAAANLYVVWQVELAKDDFLELFIRNRDNVQNLTAVNATSSVR